MSFLNFTERKQEGTWLLDLRVYDCTPQLCPLEQSALTEFLQTYEKMQTRNLPVELRRLYQPVYDALTLTGAYRSQITKATFLLFQQMMETQSTYWSWSIDAWLLFWASRVNDLSSRYLGGCLQAVAYLLTGFQAFTAVPFPTPLTVLAKHVFGCEIFDQRVTEVSEALREQNYFPDKMREQLIRPLAQAMLLVGDTTLARITSPVLNAMFEQLGQVKRQNIVLLSYALWNLGVISQPIQTKTQPNQTDVAKRQEQSLKGIAPEWVDWVSRWREKSTLQPSTKRDQYGLLLRIGRWLAEIHPSIVSPLQWTRELAVEYVATVDRWCVGDWNSDVSRVKHLGKPLSAPTKSHCIGSARRFFLDCEAWGWLQRRFDPGRYLAIPRSLQAKLVPQPERRIIDRDVWARLVWAGLNLSEADMEIKKPGTAHPYEMVKAIAVTWLFSGLRANELRRLRVGCIRWPQADSHTLKTSICYLDVPASKSQPGFTKSVAAIVGQVIMEWQNQRPHYPSSVDNYTGETVDFLFRNRYQPLGREHLNGYLIPLLCRKAGISQEDSIGVISSHRARATIASMLANGDEPMSLLALKEWLGHATINATMHYVQDNTTKLTKAYHDAGYFGRNVRTIEVLIDRSAIKLGVTVTGEPWKYYDLGHGFCTYDFFDQCPHRMACAKCSFYRPKEETLSQLQEAKGNLLRMMQYIPLTDEEQSAVKDDLEAVAKLCERLTNTQTPDGRTPRQILMESSKHDCQQ
jgi:integrase